MNRKDRVSQKVNEISAKIKKQHILAKKDIGCSATDIASLIGSQRNNITTDLNELYKEGKLIKIIGKPTLYFDRKIFETMFNIKLNDNSISCRNLTELINERQITTKICNDNTFENIIGCDGSLSVAIKQSKAAILYPPFGLHTLILGETGVGKSTFAEAMYKYGKSQGILENESPFVTFNCADYANNPQLLISQLFGYMKGSFTGAVIDKPGLIESADEGVLFLDEVHRLPPEGQEMLFTFIDKGIFRRLGEINNERSAKVLIIAATTETPDASLLRTFLRRIPMVIKIPSLKHRMLSEKFAMIKEFFSIEAVRLNYNFVVDKGVFEAMLTYSPNGNIGQLKSDVQLSVARAFLEFKIQNAENIYINLDFIPNYVRSGLLNLDKDIRYHLDQMLDKRQYSFSPQKQLNVANEEPRHDFIKYYYETMKSNLNSEDNLQKSFKDFTYIVSQSIYSDSKFPDFIDDDTIDMVNMISDTVYNELGIMLEKSIYYSIALHLIYITRYGMLNIDNVGITDEESIKIKYSDMYRTSLSIIKRLESEYQIICPNYEAYFLTVILSSSINNNQSHVAVVVIAHGEKTASNLAHVANELLGTNHVKAIDMPLSEKPDTILCKATDMVKKINQGKGVLLLVDMGSLVTFGGNISESTGIEVSVLDNISTFTVIEAARKALMPDSNLEYIVRSLINMNQIIQQRLKRRIEKEHNKKIRRIIYTVCSSGEGAAFYLEKSIKDILSESQIYDIQVIPLSLANRRQFREIIEESSKGKFVVAIVGSIDPKLEVYPFISLQDILLNNGLKKLFYLVDPELTICNKKEYMDKINIEIIWRAAAEVLEKYLQFLSSDKVLPYIREFISTLENYMGVNFEDSSMLRVYIHIACMIERLFFNGNQLKAEGDLGKYIQSNEKLWTSVKKSFRKMEELLNITISDDEIYFVVEIFKN